MANTPPINFIVTMTSLRTEGNQVFLSVDASLDDIDIIGVIRYQWQRSDGAGGWSDIAGATSTSYVLTDADVGFTIRTMAYYVDGGGTTEIAYSQPSSTILNVNDAPTGQPVIAGLLVE